MGAGGPVAGQVRINEVVAAASERIVQRPAGQYPRVGNTTPWHQAAYDDSGWRTGTSPFGHGSFTGVTLGRNLGLEMQNRVASLYLRKTFTVTAGQAASGAALEFTARYNDGFIAFLNGVEIARRNMGNAGMFAFHDQTAFSVNAGTATETIPLGVASTRLLAGNNTLCIQVHNQSLAGTSATNLLMQPALRIAGAETLVADSAEWRFFPGVAEPSGGVLDHGLIGGFLARNTEVAWAARSFNDSSWPVGAGPVGADGANPPQYPLGTNLHAEVVNVTPSIYQRNLFAVSAAEAGSTSPLEVSVDYDDGIIVYLNGRELLRRNVGTAGVATGHAATASTPRNATGDSGTVGDQTEVVTLGAAREWLVAGDNVLAIQLHRSHVGDDDAIGRVTLETTGAGGRVLARPSDPTRYFVGTDEPVADGGEQEDIGPLEESPDAEVDWIELHNAGAVAQDLGGWSLTDDASEPRKWSFPPGTTIPAGGYRLVLATGRDSGPADGASYPHTNFQLSADGEYLALVDAAGSVADALAPGYPPQDALHSYGRDGAGNWRFFSAATPGTSNPGAGLGEAVAAPVFGVAGGFHGSAVNLALSTATAGAQIRYTTDGREPSPTTTLYQGPILVAANLIIRARAFKTGGVPSPVVTHTYLIGASAAKRSLPAILLGGDPALSFYGPNSSGGPSNGSGILAIKGGVYSGGVWGNGGDTSAFHFPSLRGRASEKPATLEYLPLAGVPLRTDFGLRISGSPYSRPRYLLTDAPTARFLPTSAPRKPSFNFFFRSEFGSRPVEYPFFEDSPLTQFTDLRVRAGKNDIANPWITDEMMRRIYKNTGQVSATGSFTSLWINGVFKGYYNLTQRLREGFMRENHGGVQAWDVRQVGEFSDGDPIHWNKMMAYLRGADLSKTANWQGVSDYLDVDNFIDYLVVNSFAGTWDWPNNNWVAARERSAAGRWRFYMWDAEGGFGVSGGRNTSYNSFTTDLVITDPKTTTTRFIPAIYTLLSASPEFNLRFADRVQKHLFNEGALVTSRMSAIFTELRDRINPLMIETSGSPVNETFHNNWIVSDIRRTTYFTQLAARNHWPAVLAPALSRQGGNVTPGFQLTITNPNGSGTVYLRTDGGDPRSPGGGINGTGYSGPLRLGATTVVRARVRSGGGVWSPEIAATFTVPPPRPTFLPGGSADWTTNANWSTKPAAYPNAAGVLVTVPPALMVERNVNLRAPVTIGGIEFPQAASAFRNRLRDQNTGNVLTFSRAQGALVEVTGTGAGHVEFENLAGTVLASELELRVDHNAGSDEHGAIRLREAWTGPGGLTKTGPGVASLTGEGKTYAGATRVHQGVLQITQPATPSASVLLSVAPGGQLRLVSGSDPGVPRVHAFGGPLSLQGEGRGSEVPDGSGQGKRGALRYDPGDGVNHAVISTAVALGGPAAIHVDGTDNRLELAGPVSGLHALVKSGGGRLALSGHLAGLQQPVMVENGTLELSAPLGPGVTVGPAGILAGSGSCGPVAGDGTVALDRTRLRVPSAAAARHALVFGSSGTADFPAPTGAGNGSLLMDEPPPAGTALDLYLNTPAGPGAVFRGGWVVPHGRNLGASRAAAIVRVLAADPLGTEVFQGRTWSLVPDWSLTTVAAVTGLEGALATARMLELQLGGSGPADFAEWQARHFPDPADRASPAVSGMAADPRQSGISNLMAYALGAAPGPAAVEALPRLVMVPGPGLEFPFDSRRDDLTVIVEASADPGDWQGGTVLFNSDVDFPPAADPVGRITVIDPAPARDRKFFRLRVVPRQP